MATNILKLIAILSLTISLLLSLYPQATFSFKIEDDEEDYVLDNPLIIPNLRSRNRFLSNAMKKDKIKKGTHRDFNSYYNCKHIPVR